jgi:hypothetical protein
MFSKTSDHQNCATAGLPHIPSFEKVLHTVTNMAQKTFLSKSSATTLNYEPEEEPPEED